MANVVDAVVDYALSADHTSVAPLVQEKLNITQEAGSRSINKDGIQGLSPLPLKVPKSVIFAERYMSPTDRLISPISKNLLARKRKAGHILAPTFTTTPNSKLMIQTSEPCFQEAGLLHT